ncbi:hypothetical protein ONS95_002975 [Cadophora gregata]|uniref:uncharacterized protein n=1 Tax=Cadophora gregata TaxID=51156 RepID=UPI0026DD3D8B|nr:uncharacterized protein ONS95_002975 [Cadophora gregata]KAK0108153.1 hypothetical protein ONS95_002975 [Cadophora gregata]KAK0109252.1 hypothetical protein ONS96_003074 [Cadophora gregata f. sp. sojae]
MLCNACIGLGESIDELFVAEPFYHPGVIDVDEVHKRDGPQAKGYRHHVSVSSLEQAAKTGCELCHLLVGEKGLSLCGNETTFELNTGPIYARGLDGRNGPQCHDTSKILFYQSNPGYAPGILSYSTSLDIYAYPDDPASRSGFIRGEPVESELSSRSYAKAKTWIQDCIAFHPRCRYSSKVFPPRVIDVGATDGSEDPRLIIDDTLRDPWVALSHCWGGGISSATLRSNIDMRLEGLPLSHLPANFRDAITITRELGYRYLWVDALCIIQDLESDWRGHLPLMGNIYQFAAVTIAADVAADSDTGIILRRERPAISVPVPYKSLSRRTGGVVYFRPALNVYPRGPIQDRGWTLQEDLLSARTIYFAADQLLWQCQTETKSEGERSAPNNQDGRGYYWGAPLKQSFLLPPDQAARLETENLPLAANLGYTPSRKALDHWYLIVNEYVERSLSVEQDRLPALFGIAQQIEKRTGYHYIAGLWKEYIHVGLLWTSNGVGQKRENIECPSWSWASVFVPRRSRVNLPYDDCTGPRSMTKGLITASPASIHSKALIKAINLDGSHGDVYGLVKSGTITIEGKFQTATDWLSRHSRPFIYMKGQLFDLSDLIKRRHYAEPMTDSPHILCKLDYHEHWPDDWTSKNQGKFEEDISFLQIYRVSGYKDDDLYPGFWPEYEKLAIAYALILESTGNEGEYRRRGMAEVPCEEGMADDGWDDRFVRIV